MKLDTNYLFDIKEDLVKSLNLLIEHIKDENTDAHKDFFPSKIKPLKSAVSKLKIKQLNLEILTEISSFLGFKRIFPLIEMSEKIKELEDTVLKRQESIVNSYRKWGIDQKELDEILIKHKLLLIRFVLEGIFRKGLVETDRLAWAPIMYNMGGRIIYEYIFAVTHGWLHEDIIKLWFVNCLMKIKNFKLISMEQDAHDSDRIFKYKKEKQNISGEPDFLVKGKFNGKIVSFYLEVQHVTKRSRKVKTNLVQVPSHRVKESKKYGEKYLFIVPYITEEDKAFSVAVISGPLKEVKENYIEGHFVNPNTAISLIEDVIKKL